MGRGGAKWEGAGTERCCFFFRKKKAFIIGAAVAAVCVYLGVVVFFFLVCVYKCASAFVLGVCVCGYVKAWPQPQI